jgi:hypothetical protein
MAAKTDASPEYNRSLARPLNGSKRLKQSVLQTLDGE